MAKRAEPSLGDLILEWVRRELPNAVQEKLPESQGEGVLFRIRKSGSNYLNLTIRPSSMVLGCAFTHLEENFDIQHDRIITGKWNSGETILAADPLFFNRITAAFCVAALVVTMGDFAQYMPRTEEEEEYDDAVAT